jgi:Uri superfamily endonuclease
MRWHIDYLRDIADDATALPIRHSQRNEHEIVDALSRIARPAAPGFGASDSPHVTHLFHCPDSPLQDPVFHQELQKLRMRHPGG